MERENFDTMYRDGKINKAQYEYIKKNLKVYEDPDELMADLPEIDKVYKTLINLSKRK